MADDPNPDPVEPCCYNVSAQMGRGLQWMKTKAQNAINIINRAFCEPSAAEPEPDCVPVSIAQPSNPHSVTINIINNSTFNKCNFTNQECPQAGPDLLQMLPKLQVHGEPRSYYFTDSVFNYSQFGDHNQMTLDVVPKSKDD